MWNFSIPKINVIRILNYPNFSLLRLSSKIQTMVTISTNIHAFMGPKTPKYVAVLNSEIKNVILLLWCFTGVSINAGAIRILPLWIEPNWEPIWPNWYRTIKSYSLTILKRIRSMWNPIDNRHACHLERVCDNNNSSKMYPYYIIF